MPCVFGAKVKVTMGKLSRMPGHTLTKESDCRSQADRILLVSLQLPRESNSLSNKCERRIDPSAWKLRGVMTLDLVKQPWRSRILQPLCARLWRHQNAHANREAKNRAKKPSQFGSPTCPLLATRSHDVCRGKIQHRKVSTTHERYPRNKSSAPSRAALKETFFATTPAHSGVNLFSASSDANDHTTSPTNVKRREKTRTQRRRRRRDRRRRSRGHRERAHSTNHQPVTRMVGAKAAGRTKHNLKRDRCATCMCGLGGTAVHV